MEGRQGPERRLGDEGRQRVSEPPERTHVTAAPGEVIAADGSITLNEGAERTTLRVVNTGDRPVQVGSHYHFAEANSALEFDRAAADLQRLDIPAGTAVRFEPGVERDVTLVPLRGNRIVPGLSLPARPDQEA